VAAVPVSKAAPTAKSDLLVIHESDAAAALGVDMDSMEGRVHKKRWLCHADEKATVLRPLLRLPKMGLGPRSCFIVENCSNALTIGDLF